MEEDYKDFRKKPSKIVGSRLENEMVRVKGIPRAINVKEIFGGLNMVEGFLELGKDYFIKFYAEFPNEANYSRNPINYLKASNESNQEVDLFGMYNSFPNEIQIKSIQLGNLGRTYFTTKMNCSKID